MPLLTEFGILFDTQKGSKEIFSERLKGKRVPMKTQHNLWKAVGTAIFGTVRV